MEFNWNWRISNSNCSFLPDLYYLCSCLWFCHSFQKNIFIAGITCPNGYYCGIIAINSFISLIRFLKRHLNWKILLWRVWVFFYSEDQKIHEIKVIFYKIILTGLEMQEHDFKREFRLWMARIIEFCK